MKEKTEEEKRIEEEKRKAQKEGPPLSPLNEFKEQLLDSNEEELDSEEEELDSNKEKKVVPSEVRVDNSQMNDEHWKRIVSAYKKEYGDELYAQGRPANTLIFPSRKAAVDFLKTQAESEDKTEFLVREIANDKPTGNYLFSCGTGKMYDDTLAKIKKELEEELKELKKEDPNNPKILKIQEGLGKIDNLILQEKTIKVEKVEDKEPIQKETQKETQTESKSFK